MSQPPYQKIWKSLGFEESDWEDGGSDRLVDAICAWGDADTIKEKLQKYEDAGATDLVIYPCNKDEDYDGESAMSLNWSWETFEALAPAGS
jgi:alkanesulfonate monooxygenase SsuD/methylene tetrahydromethanopterin reductase-like flavin-dependent oxidoreductase (luciferase family)